MDKPELRKARHDQDRARAIKTNRTGPITPRNQLKQVQSVRSRPGPVIARARSCPVRTDPGREKSRSPWMAYPWPARSSQDKLGPAKFSWASQQARGTVSHRKARPGSGREQCRVMASNVQPGSVQDSQGWAIQDRHGHYRFTSARTSVGKGQNKARPDMIQ